MQVTDELIKKAAREMCIEGGFDPDEPMPNDGPRWRYYMDGARAALTAALSDKQAGEPVAPSAWLIEDGTDHAWFTVIPSKALEAKHKGCDVTPLYTSPPLSREVEDSAEVERLTRPIVGIEHRTAQEVFDIMADRIRLAATRSGSATTAKGGVE